MMPKYYINIINIFSISCLICLSIYHLMIFIGRRLENEEKYHLYFSLFSFLMSILIFLSSFIYSNIILIYRQPIYETILVFFIYFSYTKVISEVIDFKKYSLFVPGYIVCFFIILLSLSGFVKGYKWYRENMMIYLMILAMIVVIYSFIIIAWWIKKNNLFKKRIVKLLIIGFVIIISCVAFERFTYPLYINNLLINDIIQNLYFSFVYKNFSPVVIGAFIFSAALIDKFNNEYYDMKDLKSSLESKVKQRTQELAEANEKLKELDIVKTNFFANISHELRTPLTLISGPLQSIIKGYYGKNISNKDKVFKSISNNTNRLLKLINNLLDFSKIESGKFDLKKEKTDITELIKYYISTVEYACKNKKIKLSLKTDNKVHFLNIDRRLFEKAFFNIFSNAFKFTDKGGQICIELKNENNYFNYKNNYYKVSGRGVHEKETADIFG